MIDVIDAAKYIADTYQTKCLETHIEVYRKYSVDQGMEKLIDSKLVNRGNRKYNKIFEENQSKHRA